MTGLVSMSRVAGGTKGVPRAPKWTSAKSKKLGVRSTSVQAASAPAPSPSDGGPKDSETFSTRRPRKWKQVEQMFEHALFSCRYMVLAAVVGSILMSLMLFTCGILQVWEASKVVVLSIFQHGHIAEAADLSLSSVEAMDLFLTGIVTFIFGTGVYELFLSNIKVAEQSNQKQQQEEKPGWMSVKGIDDLEMRLGKVVITVLIVQLMAVAKSLQVSTPVHMMYMGIAFFLAAAGLSLLTWVEKAHK
mmetsp:Transcript_6954/g.42527  ORF Transcript_6954/g.42527 Transcript_6954/m.42527 type:complete len:246 (+) Transcript_6954:657-1394(+)